MLYPILRRLSAMLVLRRVAEYLELDGQMQQPAFFMEILFDDSYIGNVKLTDRHTVTFLASLSTPEEDWTKVKRWLETEIFGTDKVVISGFHSPFERRVLQQLIEHNHPAIVVLARSLYKRIPAEYQKAITQKSILITSYFPKHKRNSYRYAEARNAYLMDIANEVVVIGVGATSRISTFFNLFRKSSNKPFIEL